VQVAPSAHAGASARFVDLQRHSAGRWPAPAARWPSATALHLLARAVDLLGPADAYQRQASRAALPHAAAQRHGEMSPARRAGPD